MKYAREQPQNTDGAPAGDSSEREIHELGRIRRLRDFSYYHSLSLHSKQRSSAASDVSAIRPFGDRVSQCEPVCVCVPVRPTGNDMQMTANVYANQASPECVSSASRQQ